MTGVLTRKGEERETHREDDHGRTEAEFGVMPQPAKDAKDCLQPPASRRGACVEQILPLNYQEGINP